MLWFGWVSHLHCPSARSAASHSTKQSKNQHQEEEEDNQPLRRPTNQNCGSLRPYTSWEGWSLVTFVGMVAESERHSPLFPELPWGQACCSRISAQMPGKGAYSRLDEQSDRSGGYAFPNGQRVVIECFIK